MKQHEKNFAMWLYYYLIYNGEKFQPVVTYIVLLFALTIFSLVINPDWPFVTSLLFALTTFSTGGLVALDNGSPAWQYFVLGLFAAIGIPITVRLKRIKFKLF